MRGGREEEEEEEGALLHTSGTRTLLKKLQ